MLSNKANIVFLKNVEKDKMTSRERLSAILNPKEAEQVPLDSGAGKCCKIHIDADRKLLLHFGINETVCFSSKTAQLAAASDAMLEILETDIRVPHPLFKTVKPLDEWEDETGYYVRDSWGVEMRMPKDGFYYDVVKNPMMGKIDEEEIDYKFPPLPIIAPKAVEQAKAYQAAGYPVMMPDHYGNGFLQNGPRIFGYEDWMMMLAMRDKKAIDHMEQLLEKKIQYWDIVMEAYGDSLDVVCEGDDLGMQSGPFIDPEMFRTLIKPYYKKLYDHIRKRTNAKIFLHSCGSIVKLIPDLIDVGLDILNPVQINATGMEVEFLKREYGKDITFWGGGIDTQRVLPGGSPEEIREHVRRNIEIFSKDGGFVFAAVHNIQSDVSVGNFVAMWESFKDYRKYC
jgi:uroporphyrinogen decarboxylase